ncbi:hypothetical protein CROQUDRAFT_525725 [Cronartium quercuum f. sp. fusiforme G11]|uniref:USP domain-containing protein n=1 Tax=Cronartium quercuum f. sp. fusiforme G11 TaxID=708437 RepID=A0A9P6NLI8_9BASI|nr:hypothetical protein CROQUDRAFT_525725 [Cronartium quercuum f. sp. fusiforme G11]
MRVLATPVSGICIYRGQRLDLKCEFSSRHNQRFTLDRNPHGDLEEEWCPSKNFNYPGLANTSANLCFLNAVLQSLASINELTNYLLRIRKRWDHQIDKIPIVCAVQELLEALNTPQARPTVLRPTGVIQALANSNDISSSIFDSSDQQDAQEFFALLMDAIDLEIKSRESDHLIHIPTGLAVLLSAEQKEARLRFKNTALRNPMQSLMAHRIACATCGFSSVIRHQTADHFSFNVPSAVCPVFLFYFMSLCGCLSTRRLPSRI